MEEIMGELKEENLYFDSTKALRKAQKKQKKEKEHGGSKKSKKVEPME